MTPLPDLTMIRELAADASCLPVGHPVWGVPGSPGAMRTRAQCIDIARASYGLQPLLPPSSLGNPPIRSAQLQLLDLCEGDPVCARNLEEMDIAAGGILGAVAALERATLGGVSSPVTGLADVVLLPNGTTVPRADLARALIATGQLQLGPSAFQTPEAMRALGMGLAIAAQRSASPTGGNMSSAWFGLGGAAPGGTTPFLPFGFPSDAGSPLIAADAVGGGSVFGSILGAIPGLLTGLAQAGVIRGSVGQALAPMQQMAAMQAFGPAAAASLPAVLGSLPSMGTILGAGSLAVDAMQALGGFFGSGPSCGASRPPVMAPTLFKMNACGRMSLPARQQVIAPDGSIYVVASLGKATRGAREESTMRRLARQNGFTVARKGAGARGRRRRPR